VINTLHVATGVTENTWRVVELDSQLERAIELLDEGSEPGPGLQTHVTPGGQEMKVIKKHFKRLHRVERVETKTLAAVATHKAEVKKDAAVRSEVAHTLDKQMAQKDAALTKVSKAELDKEIAKLQPGFNAQQSVRALNAAHDAAEQAHMHHGDYDKQLAQLQAGILPKDMVKQKEQALSAEDHRLLHVSKRELAQEMAEIAGEAKKGPTALSFETDQLNKAISQPTTLPIDMNNRGNPFHMTKAGKKLIVKRPVIKKLNGQDSQRAMTQAVQQTLSTGQKQHAAQQSKTKMFALTANRQKEASKQAKGMHRLHGEARVEAARQPAGMNLKRSDEKAAHAQAAESRLSQTELKSAFHQTKMHRLKGPSKIAAVQQSKMPSLSMKEQRSASQQATTQLFRISQNQAVKAFQQARPEQLTSKAAASAAEQDELLPLSSTAKRNARTQASGMKLTRAEKDVARMQPLGMVLHGQDEVKAADNAKPDTLNKLERAAAARQSRSKMLTIKERLSADEQAHQKLHVKDALNAAVQAAAVPPSAAEANRARQQANGEHYSKVRKSAQKQAATKMFKTTPDEEISAQKQAAPLKLHQSDSITAYEQAKQKLNPRDLAVAKDQAERPHMDLSKEKEAQKLTFQQGYSGHLRAMARAQAKTDATTGRVTPDILGESKAQASDAPDPRALIEAREQSSLDKLSKKDKKMSLEQTKQMYGFSNKQAVDTVTKLTVEKRLFALRQTEDKLKKRDAEVAKQQAKEVRMSLQDEWDAAHQAKDTNMWALSKRDKKKAAKRLVSSFNGDMSAKDIKLAADLADKALKKRQDFLSGYEAWEERNRERKIRQKYQREREMLLGESAESQNKPVAPSDRVHSKITKNRTKKVAALTPLSLKAFHKKLEAIKRTAQHDMDSVAHQLENVEKA